MTTFEAKAVALGMGVQELCCPHTRIPEKERKQRRFVDHRLGGNEKVTSKLLAV
jgi:hypothetical protein